MLTNPWNLTPRQAQIVAALICNGASTKLAARILGCTERSIDIGLQRARQRMGVKTRFDVLITWDRWVQLQRR